MTIPNPVEMGLSPLDQIRQTEAEVTRQIAAAREAAEQIVAEARKQVKARKEDAQASGQQQGQIRYKELVSRAEEEAQAIVTQTKSQASALKQRGQQGMGSAVDFALNFILGLEGKEQ